LKSDTLLPFRTGGTAEVKLGWVYSPLKDFEKMKRPTRIGEDPFEAVIRQNSMTNDGADFSEPVDGGT
jgi:hypothetical protein